MNHSYPIDVWQAGEMEPVRIHGWMELPPGEYRLAAYLRNPRTGDQGELARDVVIFPGK